MNEATNFHRFMAVLFLWGSALLLGPLVIRMGDSIPETFPAAYWAQVGTVLLCGGLIVGILVVCFLFLAGIAGIVRIFENL